MRSPTGRSIDVGFYDGEKSFEKSDREYYSLGYAFEHHFDEVWTVRQNARYLRSEGQYRSLYNNYLMADYRTIRRSTIATDVDMDAYTLDNQVQATFDTGPLQHTALMGLDYQNTRTDTLSGSGTYTAGPTLDIFNPVYGAAVAVPAYTTDGNVAQRTDRRVPARTGEMGQMGAAAGRAL